MPDTQVRVEVEIAAPPARVWDGLVNDMGTWFDPTGKGDDMSMRLESRVGGRMFRDLGEDSGHLWGFVQVIKPPNLLEIAGPMWRSAASISHVQIRLEENVGGTRLTLIHDALNVGEDNMDGVHDGWTHMLEKGLKPHVEQR